MRIKAKINKLKHNDTNKEILQNSIESSYETKLQLIEEFIDNSKIEKKPSQIVDNGQEYYDKHIKIEDKYRLIFDNVNDEIIYLNRYGKILDVNRRIEEILGFKPEEIIGKHFTRLGMIRKRDIPRVLKIFKDALKGKPKFILELDVKHKDGHYVTIEASSRPLKKDGKIVGFLILVRDISKRKRIEKELKKSNQRFEDIALSSADWIWEVDNEGKYTFASGKVKEILGYEPSYLIGKTPFDFMPDDEKTRVGEIFSKFVIEKKPIVDLENWNIHKDGKKICLLTNGVPLFDDSGNLLGYRGVDKDITIQKISEKALQESEKRYSDLFENASDLIQAVKPDGTFLFVNQSWKKTLGYSDDDLKSLNVFNIIHPTSIEHCQHVFKKVLSGEETRTIEAVFISKNCDEIYVEGSINCRFENGEPISTRGIFRDVTEKKKSEQRMEKLNLMKGKLLEIGNLQEKLHIVTDTVVESLKADFARIWIIKQGDLCNKGCIHAEHKEGIHVCQHKDRCLHLKASSGRYTHLDGQVHKRVPFGCYKIGRVASGIDEKFITNDVTHDSRIHDNKWAEELGLTSFAGYKLTSEQGDPIGVLALFSKRKITLDDDILLETIASTIAQVIQTKHAEEKVKIAHDQVKELNESLEKKVEERTAEVQRLLDQKDAFITQLGHDLKTPLGPLINLLPIIEKDITDSRLKEIMSVSLRNTYRIKSLVAKTLKLALLNAPSTIMNLNTFNLVDEIKNVVESNKILFDKHNITVDILIKDTITVQADKDQLDELFENLINNAVKYSPKGGVVTIDAIEEQNELTVSVKDLGIGIDAEETGHIFEEFYKVDQSRHDLDSSGLGLPICKRIVEKHSGKIWVESKGSGKGSTFYFTLPYV